MNRRASANGAALTVLAKPKPMGPRDEQAGERRWGRADAPMGPRLPSWQNQDNSLILRLIASIYV